jgi:hypothetical protein
MITVRLMGGLGNQMFQFAAGRRLAQHHGVPLRLDLGWFGHQAPGDTPREYELGVFALDGRVEKAVVDVSEPRNRVEQVRARLRGLRGDRPHVLRQQGTAFQAEVLDAPDGTHLIGFWGSERYFSDAADIVRADLAPAVALSDASAALAERIAAAPAPVSLHVRRGDYLTNANAAGYHGVMGVDYYARAVELVTSRVGGEVQLFAFSDDPDWCAAELPALGHPLTVVRGNDGAAAIEDMLLMAACRHHVIANSTFSWWGAWLDGREGAVVVAPERWALDQDGDFSAIYAEGWLRA